MSKTIEQVKDEEFKKVMAKLEKQCTSPAVISDLDRLYTAADGFNKAKILWPFIKEERKIKEKEHKSINKIYNLVQSKIKKAKTPIEELEELEELEEPTKGGSKGKSRKYRKKILFKKRRTLRRRRKF